MQRPRPAAESVDIREGPVSDLGHRGGEAAFSMLSSARGRPAALELVWSGCVGVFGDLAAGEKLEALSSDAGHMRCADIARQAVCLCDCGRSSKRQ